MDEQDTSCPEMLVQIVTIRSALNGVGRVIIDDHLVESVLRRYGMNGLTELWLMDIDFDRRKLIGELC